MQISILSELSDLSPTNVLLVTCLVLMVIYYIYWSHSHTVWQRVGVPGPRPWPIIDHKLEIGQDLYVTMEKWFKQYGNSFGVYGIIPHVPSLVTKDLYLAKQVLIKDFSNFVDRYRPMKTWSSSLYGVTSSVGDTWRRQNSVTSSMFTFKQMLPQVCASAHNLTELVTPAAAAGELIPLRPLLTKFSTEVITRVAFGIQTHDLCMEETEFAYHCRNLYNPRSKPTERFLSKACDFVQPLGPVLEFFNLGVDYVNRSSDNYLVNILKTTIEERGKERKSDEKIPRQPRDLLDILLEAVVDDDDVRLKEATSKKLSPREVIGNINSVVLSGVQTIPAAIQNVIYSLACYPHIQEKVIEEIDRVIPKGQQVEYGHLAKLKYTQQVIDECQRMHPLVVSIFRWTKETKTYNDITVPVGTIVHISSAHIMMDPDIWPEPEKFDPDRFSPDNKATRDPIAFMPFGHGPRHCLGKRLAPVVLKVALVYLLRRVTFKLTEKSTPKIGEVPKKKYFNLLGRAMDTPFILEAIPRE